MQSRSTPHVLFLCCLGSVLLSLNSVGCRTRSEPLSILLVVADTLRADALGVYGGSISCTPHLDQLALESLVFTRAYSVSSWTLPAVATMLTGRMPTTYRPGAASYMEQTTPTLAEALRDHGYVSAAFVANPAMAPELGFERGFALYRGFGQWQRAPGPPRFDKTRASELTDAAIAWLGTLSSRAPWFLYVHYMDPHWPYWPDLSHLRPFWKGDLPTPEAVEAINVRIRERTYTRAILALARDLYHGAVAEFDFHVIRLVREAKRLAQGRVIIVVVSDHGEEFGDHGDVLHARTLFEEMIHVPLLVHLPTRRQAILPHTVSVAQIPATIWEAAGLGSSPFPGPSLLSGSTSEIIRAELFPFPPAIHSRAIVQHPWKLIVSAEGASLLYQIDADPKEQQNRASEQTAVVARLQSLLPDATGSSPPATPNPEARERMRALGYDF